MPGLRRGLPISLPLWGFPVTNRGRTEAVTPRRFL